MFKKCTGTNPRYRLIKDLKELFIVAYRGFSLESHPTSEFSPIGNCITHLGLLYKIFLIF
jgi:hypothetical protein